MPNRQNRKCAICGHDLVFTRTIRRGGRVIRRRDGKVFVFCSNRTCRKR